MNRKGKLFRLHDDCRKYKNGAGKDMAQKPDELAPSKMAVSKSLDTSSYHFDFNAPISLSYSPQHYPAPFEHENYHQAYSITEDLGEADYYVEPFQEAIEEKPAVREGKNQPMEAEHGQEDVPSIEDEKEEVQTGKKTGKPEIISSKKDLNDKGNKEFEADLKAILKGKKQYDPDKKQVIPKAEGPISKKEPKPEPTKGGPQVGEEFEKNEHAIFDKIAKSMKYANSYDLGNISLEKRFDTFDNELDKGKKKTKPAPNPGIRNKGENTVKKNTEIGTAELLADLDEINKNGQALSPKNGGRYAEEKDLEIGDIILMPVALKPSQSNNKEAKSQASVYLGEGKLALFNSSKGKEAPLLESIPEQEGTVVLRHKDMTEESGLSVKKQLEEAIQSDGKDQRWAKVRNLALKIKAEVCELLPADKQTDCKNFLGKVQLGTKFNNAFYANALILEILDKAQLSITTKAGQWPDPEDLINLDYNGALRYIGHLTKNNTA